MLTRNREDRRTAPTAAPAGASWPRPEPPATARERIGAYLDLATLLGRRTAEMHLALASNVDDAEFTPEPYSTLDRRSNYQTVRNLVGKTLRRCATARPTRRRRSPRRRGGCVDGQERVLKVFEPLLDQRLTGLQIRTHGDFHLEQVLYTGNDFVLIDFDGPPTETLAERRRKHICLRDVAGMIRSFHYAASTSLLETAVVRDEDRSIVAPWADAWYRWVSGAFLRSYLDAHVRRPVPPCRPRISSSSSTPRFCRRRSTSCATSSIAAPRRPPSLCRRSLSARGCDSAALNGARVLTRSVPAARTLRRPPACGDHSSRRH